jgi:hypothetical protein
LICPNCQQAITVSDTVSGTPVTCTNCSHTFTAPELYSLEPIAQPPAIPKAAPQTSPPEANPKPPHAVAAEAAPASEPRNERAPSLEKEGALKSWSLPLNRTLFEWLAPCCLVLIFLLTFFRWVGFFPAGFPAYTQNPWQAMFGDMSVDPVSEKVLGKEEETSRDLHASWWLPPYFILLLAGLALAWIEPILKRLKTQPPRAIENLLRFRPAALSACVGLTLFFLLMQSMAGFGLEHALKEKVSDETLEEKKKAKTPEEVQIAEIKTAQSESKFHVRGTFVWRLALFLHFIALAGIIGETVLIHRGPKPPPRIGVMW